jgi:hypothetical protein
MLLWWPANPLSGLCGSFVAKSQRRSPCGAAEARVRVTAANAYLETARLVASETGPGFSSVTAGLAVLAGIAASDAICCLRLGQRSRGHDHTEATALLRQATPDGDELAIRLERLLGLKDTSQYGVSLVSAADATTSVRWATRLVERAQEEVER